MTVASKVNQTIANLKSVESILRLYSIKSMIEQEKEAYKKSLKVIEAITLDIENRLKAIELEEPQYKAK